jgi:hypothetical protein
MWKFRNNIYSTKTNALKDFGAYVFDRCIAYKDPFDYTHEEKLFYALNVMENKTVEQWKELYELGLNICNYTQEDFSLEEIENIDSFIFDHESPWEDPDNQILEMLRYYHEYHTQKQHS